MDIRDFLSRLRVDSGPNGKGEYMCRCPAHDDKNASLCVRDGEKGIVLKCQAGCDVESVVSAMGLKMRDLFHEQQQTSNTQNHKAPAAKTAAKPSGAKKPRGKFVCAYQYTDERKARRFTIHARGSRCAPPRWPATGACAATAWTGTAAAWASAPIAPRWCITSFPWKNGQTLPCPLKTCAACAMRAIIKITPKRAADGRPKNRSNIKCA